MANDEIVFGNENPEFNDEGMTAKDFSGGSFLKNPAVGEELVLDILKVEQSDKTTARNKTTDKEFSVGLKQKNGEVKRYDVICTNGTYTISNWEVYFKLFGAKGVLMEYAKKNNGSFKGAKVSIKRVLDGGYANYKEADLAKILDITIPQAVAKINEIKQAIKEQRLFSVTLVK